MKNLKKLFIRFFCFHFNLIDIYVAKSKRMFSGSNKSKTNLRFDIYERRICKRCGKIYHEYKVKSNLTEQQAKLLTNKTKSVSSWQ